MRNPTNDTSAPLPHFYSSVQKELADERRELKAFINGDALLRQFFDVFLFEDLPASDRRADEVYLTEVDRCDLYVGIFGNEYGYEDADGVSPTEREFARATVTGKTRLIFVKGAVDGARHPKMQALIRKAGDQLIRRRFVGVPDLMAALYASLVEHLGRCGAIQTGPFDAAVCHGATLADISEEKVSAFLARAQRARGYALGPDTPMRDALVHLNLLNADRPSNAAILLFGSQPQRFLMSSEVKCLRLQGTEVRKPIASYQVYKGDLFQLMDSAVDFVMGKLDRGVGTRVLSNEAPVTFEIPRDAVAEAIVNAIAHRDYSSNASVQVMLFSDRLEVWNPGHLPPTLTIASLRRPHASVPHNPLIAEPLFLTRLVERAGSGILDMIALCVEAGLKPPDFRQDAGSFVQTLWRPAQVTVQVGTKSGTKSALSRHQVAILSNCFEDNDLLSLMKFVGRTDRSKFRHQVIDPLIAAGLMEMTIRDKPRSRLQRYRTTDHGLVWLAERKEDSSSNVRQVALTRKRDINKTFGTSLQGPSRQDGTSAQSEVTGSESRNVLNEKEIRHSRKRVAAPKARVAMDRKGRATGEVTVQVTGQVTKMLSVLRGEMNRTSIQAALGLKHRDHFNAAYLTPAIKTGLVEATIPDKPNSRLQKYRLTKKGLARLQGRKR